MKKASYVKITIDCDNAAFGEDAMSCADEVVRILRKLADDIAADGSCFPARPVIRDANGNWCGEYIVTE